MTGTCTKCIHHIKRSRTIGCVHAALFACRAEMEGLFGKRIIATLPDFLFFLFCFSYPPADG